MPGKSDEQPLEVSDSGIVRCLLKPVSPIAGPTGARCGASEQPCAGSIHLPSEHAWALPTPGPAPAPRSARRRFSPAISRSGGSRTPQNSSNYRAVEKRQPGTRGLSGTRKETPCSLCRWEEIRRKHRPERAPFWLREARLAKTPEVQPSLSPPYYHSLLLIRVSPPFATLCCTRST